MTPPPAASIGRPENNQPMDLLYVTVQWQCLENLDDLLVCYDGDEGWISVLCKKNIFHLPFMSVD